MDRGQRAHNLATIDHSLRTFLSLPRRTAAPSYFHHMHMLLSKLIKNLTQEVHYEVHATHYVTVLVL